MKLNYLQPHIEILTISVDIITTSFINDEGELGCKYGSVFGGEWQ